jgi:ABC-type nitrate/sulfonate/bicarbonate transport system permease component
MIRVTKSLQGALPIIVIILLWEGIARAEIVYNVYFPSATVALQALITLLIAGDLIRDNTLTLMRAFAGFGLGVLLGTLLGIASASSRWIHGLLEPLVEFLRPMPSASIIPLAILFLGLKEITFIIIIAYAAAWPVYINTLNSLRGIDRVLEDTGKSYGLTLLEQLLEIRLPSAAPMIATGLRISLGIALISTIVAEMLIGQQGLGFFILTMAFTQRIPEMYAGIVLTGLNGFIVNALFAAAIRNLLHWHESLAATKEREIV